MPGVSVTEAKADSYARTRATRPRAAVVALIALFIGGGAGLLLAEFSVRIFAPQSLLSDVIAFDPDVDYRLRPNATGRMTSPEYYADIRVNSLGFRGPEISLAKKPGVARVLFLGDSFAFGHGLKENETLPALVGEELERKHPGKFEVVNGGVYGYSTADELSFFLKFGAPLKPDVVATLFFTNDFADNALAYRLERDGRLVKQRTRSDYTKARRITRFLPGADWLRGHSHLFKFVGVRLLPVVASGTPTSNQDGDPSRPPPTAEGLPAEFDPGYYKIAGGPFQVTTALLAELAKAAQENGARSVLLTLGEALEFRDGKLRPQARLLHERLAAAALHSGYSRALSLPTILADYKGKEPLYFPVDTHWTAAATKLVAPEVADAIAQTAAAGR